jgi:type II secretory pathway pseudopilin PulG
MRTKKTSRKGFTIIELMLAMGFLSALLVTIALLVIQITGIYQKGLALRAVSSTGKQLIDEFSRAVGSSPITDINPVDINGNNIIDDVDIAAAVRQYFYTRTSGNRQLNGAFCTGSYSYVWNTRYSYPPGELGSPVSLSTSPTGTGGTVYKLARVADGDRRVCEQMVANRGNIEVDSQPIELISSDESDLILYDMTVFPATQHNITKQTFYSATFILGTIRGGVNLQSSGDYCDVEGGSELGLSSDFNYCAVNKFNFAMRATGFTDNEDQFGNQYGEGGAE